MTAVIIGMLVTLLIAGAVVAAVAVPAHREGRDLLSPEGEQLVQAARDRTAEAVESARDKARDRVGELAERLPVSPRDADEPAPEPAPSAGPAEIDLRTDPSDVGQHRRHA